MSDKILVTSIGKNRKKRKKLILSDEFFDAFL